eukprot:Nk52_evm98s224 gene=Nk52_evmTU98s224
MAPVDEKPASGKSVRIEDVKSAGSKGDNSSVGREEERAASEVDELPSIQDSKPVDESVEEGEAQVEESVVVEEEVVSREEENPVCAIDERYLASLIVDEFIGDQVDGQYHGHGTAIYRGGSIYEGDWKDNKMHGKGLYTWSDGVTYEGDFFENEITGTGKFVWPEEGSYEGDVSEGYRHGHGSFRFFHSDVLYVGEWKRGKRHGQGTLFYTKDESSYYKGEWVEDKMEGQGTMVFKNGNIYDGEFKQNQRHGQGTMQWLNKAEEYSGQWANGIQSGYGVHVNYRARFNNSQFPLRNHYEGEWANGKRCGHGTFQYANGSKYVGQWFENKKHGQGKYTFEDGSKYVGEFVNDGFAKKTPIKTVSTDLQFKMDIKDIAGDSYDDELKHINRVILLYVSDIKRIYKFYSKLAEEESADNTYILSKFQFWRLILDCKINCYKISPADINRAVCKKYRFSSDAEEVDEYMDPHNPGHTMLLRQFIEALVRLGDLLYIQTPQTDVRPVSVISPAPSLGASLSKLIKEHILPGACNVMGYAFGNPEGKLIMSKYDKRLFNLFYLKAEYSKHSLPSSNNDLTITIRNFLFMLKEFRVFSDLLTATEVVEIFKGIIPCACEDNSYSLEHEMVFLEFVEVLIGCALTYNLNHENKEQLKREEAERIAEKERLEEEERKRQEEADNNEGGEEEGEPKVEQSKTTKEDKDKSAKEDKDKSAKEDKEKNSKSGEKSKATEVEKDETPIESSTKDDEKKENRTAEDADHNGVIVTHASPELADDAGESKVEDDEVAYSETEEALKSDAEVTEEAVVDEKDLESEELATKITGLLLKVEPFFEEVLFPASKVFCYMAKTSLGEE